ncbi:MAG: protein-glutamate O-methyltransferase CheR [Sporolactobacillus sp.]
MGDLGMDLENQQDYEKFKGLFFRLTGINLSLYKEEQMKRRLNTFRLKKDMPTFVDFYQAMKLSDQLLGEFLSRMTINVTEFFRNPSRWEVLDRKMAILAQKKRKISVWSAACSTGEEAYSLAILLQRHLPTENLSITATDIDQEVLRKAEEGRYLETGVASVPAVERQRFFTKKGLFYTVDPLLKKSIRFLHQDLLHDPAPGFFDLVVCRNVLIYFTEEGKNLIYRKISDSLNSGGLLFVGSTEQIFHPEVLNLQPSDTFFYKKLGSDGAR